MNERQRDLFLYEWSRRRAPGRARVALRGAIIGALGGVLFTVLMMSAGALEFGNTSASLMSGLGNLAKMLGLAVPAFGAIGYVGANRVYAQQEAMYQAILQTGAQPPAEKPQLQGADRWPAIAVGVAVVIIAGFIIALFIAYW